MCKTKATCKHLGDDFSLIKRVICEKEHHRKRLISVNRSLRAAVKVNNSYEANDVQKCLRVTKVAFDTYTEHTN